MRLSLGKLLVNLLQVVKRTNTLPIPQHIYDKVFAPRAAFIRCHSGTSNIEKNTLLIVNTTFNTITPLYCCLLLVSQLMKCIFNCFKYY